MHTRIASLLLPLALLAACSKPAEQKADSKPTGPAPVPVTLAAAKAVNLQRSVRVVGSLAGLETVTLSNRVTGQVARIYKERGDRVEPNEKLLEIERDRFELAVNDSKGALSQTLARLGLKEVPPENFNVSETAPVKKAMSEYNNAKNKYERAVPVHESRTMNDFEFLDIESAYKSAESALENSRDEARALVAQARQNANQIEMKSKDFQDTIVRAPSGTVPGKDIKVSSYVVADRKVSQGEYLREGTALFTLVADSTLKLQARVPERYLGDVRDGATVTFKVEAYPDETFTGTVSIVDPTVDPASRTFQVEALVDNAKYQDRLRPGSFVPGEVLTKTAPNCVMVPLEAVTSFVGVTKVFKLDPADHSKVKAIDVTTGQQIADGTGPNAAQWIEITKGDLNAGEQVVISGLTKLVDGSPITLANQSASSTPPATQPN